MQQVWDSAPFTVDYQHGPGDQLVIAFSSVGHDPTRPPSPEFVRSLSGKRALFVRDAARSWANDPGFEAAVLGAYRAACEAGPVVRVMTLGLSMGAFAALVAAQVLPVDVVLAFGPQYSIAPGSGETRWATWTDRLTAPRWPPLRWHVAPLPARGWVCLFHGGLDDLPQALAFPVQAGVDQVLFDGVGHSDLMPHLKAKGVLAGLIEAGMQGDRRRLLRISAGAGGVRRRFTQACVNL